MNQTQTVSYREKLQHPKWQRRRLEIMQFAQFRCEDCKRSDKTLEIHHCAYIKGNEPWEYDNALLMCLCSACHETRQKREDAIRVSLGQILRTFTGDQVEDAAWNVIELLVLRRNEKLAESFS